MNAPRPAEPARNASTDAAAAVIAPPAPRIDPLAVLGFGLSRALPPVAWSLYGHGTSKRLSELALVSAWLGWLGATVRVRRAIRAQRPHALRAAMEGLLAASPLRTKGAAHDALLAMIWRGLAARGESMRGRATMIGAALALPVALLAVGWALGGTMVAVAVVAALVGFGANRPLARAHRRAADALAREWRRLARTFGRVSRGSDEIRAGGLGEALRDELAIEAKRLGDADAKASRWGLLATAAPVAAIGATFVVGARMLGGDPIVALVTALTLAPIAADLLRESTARTSRASDHARFSELAATLRDPPPPAAAIAWPTSHAPIVWSRVSFRHRAPLSGLDAASDGQAERAPSADGAAVLDDVEIRWSTRRPLALIGENGSGKSTVIALLLRLADPDEGAVTIGGVDVRALDHREARARIAYVPQRPLSLEGQTVREGLAHAGAAPTSELQAVLARVGLRVDLEAPVASLSGGMIQRLALARALLRKPALLVLDEPEASLDRDGRAHLASLLTSLAAEGCAIVMAAQHRDALPADAVEVTLPLAKGARIDC